MELLPIIQTYDWGKLGSSSIVATFYKNVNPDFVIDPKTPYAELWIGTHVNGPARVKALNKTLGQVITEIPDSLGDNVTSKFGHNLPYLVKVLSVNKALSIQVHPSKVHAEQLHANHPDIYKDSNHKPELAIALTQFEALCGFRPNAEIADFLRIIPELESVIGNTACTAYIQEQSESNLKACFTALMTCPNAKVKGALEQMVQRLSKLDKKIRTTQLADLLQQLHSQYPGDVGCFAIYFLNYLQLKPLEAIYLGANTPHAYIAGECVECMANSDNVVRAGLTPKFKDVDTLCAMLTYIGEPASQKLFQSINENKYIDIYKPPVPDFALAKIQSGGATEIPLIVRSSGSILLVICGTAVSDNLKFKPGTSVFIRANEQLTLQSVAKNFLAFQAMANV